MKVTSLLAAAALATSLAALPAHAQLMRTFVSAAGGNDANDCSLATPCRSFQGAHDKTLDQGEVTVLDPGGYGAVTITKSISIVNDGVGEAGTLVSGGAAGITINAPSAAYINLRGLTVQGIGFGGGTGLKFNSGFALTITRCVFRNHTGIGIDFAPAPINSTSNLSISDTLVADNGSFGIVIEPFSSGVTVRAVVSRVHIVNNGDDGILLVSDGDAINTTAIDTVSANNRGAGFSVFANGPLNRTASLVLVRSVSANNGTGVSTNHLGTSLRVGQSTITGNNTTWKANDGTLQSFGDNYIAGNRDGDPPPPRITTK